VGRERLGACHGILSALLPRRLQQQQQQRHRGAAGKFKSLRKCGSAVVLQALLW